MALSIDQANAVSTRHFDKGKITDQVYEEVVVLDRLKKSNRIVVKGGTKIQHTIRHAELGDAAMIDPDAGRLTAQYDTRTALELDWRWAKCDIPMTWKERTYNKGEKQIINLMADKYTEGAQEIAKLISTQFHQAYTSKGSYDMDGFFSCVRAAATTYAGISQSDASAWNRGLYDITTATLALYGTGSIDAGIQACWFRDRPDLMITTRALASIYASKLQPGERRKPEGGRAGATDLYFASIPIITDAQTNDNTWMYVKTDLMFLFVSPDDNFDVGPWESDPDHFKAIRCLYTVVGNFLFTRRKAFGAYTALTS